MAIDSSMYWDIDSVNKHDRLLNFVVGGRSIGKTYGCKRYAMGRWLSYGERFLFLRRHKTQLSDICNFFVKFSGADAEKYRDKWSVTKDGKFLHDGKVAGYYTSLTQLTDKGKDYDNVTTVIYDEFIIANDGYKRYIKDEVDQLLGAIDTIGRYQHDVKVYMLANNVSTYNPYFLALEYQYDGRHNLWLPRDEYGLRSESLVMQCDSSKLRGEYEQTRFGRMIKGTQYGAHALYNEELTGQTDFIRSKNREATIVCNLRVNGKTYGLWRDLMRGEYYVSHQTQDGMISYAGTETDQTNGYYGFGALRKSMVYAQLINALNYGKLYYQDSICRGAIFCVLKGGL